MEEKNENGWSENKKWVTYEFTRIANDIGLLHKEIKEVNSKLDIIGTSTNERMSEVEKEMALMKRDFRWLYGVGMFIVPAIVSFVLKKFGVM